MEEGTQYQCKIKVWSSIGHTPITNRKGNYCDELATKEIAVASYKDAEKAVNKLIAETPHAASGHYDIPEYWNHNQRNGWVR